jgi:hypothetical protein
MLELCARELLELGLGVVRRAAFANPRPQLLHDVFDIDRFGAATRIGHRTIRG